MMLHDEADAWVKRKTTIVTHTITLMFDSATTLVSMQLSQENVGVVVETTTAK